MCSHWEPPLGGLTLPNPIKQKEKKKEIKKEIEREKIYSAYIRQRRRNIFLTHIFYIPDNSFVTIIYRVLPGRPGAVKQLRLSLP